MDGNQAAIAICNRLGITLPQLLDISRMEINLMIGVYMALRSDRLCGDENAKAELATVHTDILFLLTLPIPANGMDLIVD